MLHCKVCKLVKEDEHFYASNQTTCKECVKANVRANRKDKIEYYREYDRQRAYRPDRVQARQAYSKTEQGKEAANRAKRRWGSDNAKKRRATYAVNNAVRDGKLVKPESCSQCGSGGRIEGHHDDYDKVMDITWLCSQCHRSWHKEHGEARNAQ